jgi:DHA1 family bicyclomycin/chloramphenicol resistance-like MFS transporter
MLEQQKGDSGAVSSLIGCTGLLMGSLGMTIISLPWNNMILTLGIMTISTAVLALVAWPFVITRVIRLPGMNEKLTQSNESVEAS